MARVNAMWKEQKDIKKQKEFIRDKINVVTNVNHNDENIPEKENYPVNLPTLNRTQIDVPLQNITNTSGNNEIKIFENRSQHVEQSVQNISNQAVEIFHHPQQIEVFNQNNTVLNLAQGDANGWLQKSKIFVLTREQDLAAFKAQTEAKRQEAEARRQEAEARRQELMAQADAKRLELMSKIMCPDE